MAEHVLTDGPDDATSRIIIPIGANQQSTLARTTVVRSEKGVIWRGTVEDTAESAVLQWRKDGPLTGEFGHKGHIYTVMNKGSDLHAVLEVDPKNLPPDHPTRGGDGHAQPRAEPPLPKVEPITFWGAESWRPRRSSSM